MKDFSKEWAEKHHGSKLQGRHAPTEEQMIEFFEEDPGDIWINSFGGCRSNWIEGALRKKYNTQTKFYDLKGCHYVRPLPVEVDMGVFCYVEDVGIALSCIDRKLATGWHVYEKLVPPSEYKKMLYDVGHWLNLISMQIDAWASNPHFPTLILNTDKLNDEDAHAAFEILFDVPGELKPFKKRATQELADWVKPHAAKIKRINNKLANLPDFEIRVPKHTLIQRADMLHP